MYMIGSIQCWVAPTTSRAGLMSFGRSVLLFVNVKPQQIVDIHHPMMMMALMTTTKDGKSRTILQPRLVSRWF